MERIKKQCSGRSVASVTAVCSFGVVFVCLLVMRWCLLIDAFLFLSTMTMCAQRIAREVFRVFEKIHIIVQYYLRAHVILVLFEIFSRRIRSTILLSPLSYQTFSKQEGTGHVSPMATPFDTPWQRKYSGCALRPPVLDTLHVHANPIAGVACRNACHFQ